MRKLLLLTFVGVSCIGGSDDDEDPFGGMKLEPASTGYSYDANPGAPETFILTVSNTGELSFDWNDATVSAWLSVDPTNGSLQQGESVDLDVTVDVASLPDGVSASDVVIEWTEGSTKEARVSVYIDGGQGWTIVDGVNGDDDTGDGTIANPYKTIMKGMEAAVSVYSVVCLPATYEEAVTLGEGLTLVGTGPQGCVIDAGTGPSVTVSDLITNATTLSGFTVTGDDPAADEGAAMTCEGSPAVSDCEFVSCRGSTDTAAVLLKGSAGATFSNCAVNLNNTSGIICLESSCPVISHCEISNNVGNGLNCAGSSDPIIEFCEMSSNGMAAVYASDFAQPVMDANTFSWNVQGIALAGNSFSVIINNVVTGCGPYPGVASKDAASAVMTNNTIVYNAEGIWWGSSSPWSIENNIIFYNMRSQWDRYIHPEEPLQDSPLPDPYAYNAIQNVSTAEGVENIWYPPSFVDDAAGDLRLDGGECVNSGSDSAAFLPGHDRDNNARIMGGQVDRGAYEFVE